MRFKTACILVANILLLAACAQKSHSFPTMFTEEEPVFSTSLKIDQLEVVEITNNSNWEYHIFLDSVYKDSIFLNNQEGVDPSARLESFHDFVWLVVQKLDGRGTGFLEVSEVWYLLSGCRTLDHLKYTSDYSLFQDDIPYNVSYKQKITEMVIENETYKIYTEAIAKYYEPNNKKLLFQDSYYQAYTLMVDESHSRELQDTTYFVSEKTGIYVPLSADDFLVRYYPFLLRISEGEDSDKLLWLSNFLENVITDIIKDTLTANL